VCPSQLDLSPILILKLASVWFPTLMRTSDPLLPMCGCQRARTMRKHHASMFPQNQTACAGHAPQGPRGPQALCMHPARTHQRGIDLEDLASDSRLEAASP